MTNKNTSKTHEHNYQTTGEIGIERHHTNTDTEIHQTLSL